jgi:hypothetical protein
MSVRLNIRENQRYGSANCPSLQNFRSRPPHRYSPTVCIAAGGSPLRVSPPRTDYQRVESLRATRLFARASPSTPSATRNAAARSLTSHSHCHSHAVVRLHALPSLPLIFPLLSPSPTQHRRQSYARSLASPQFINDNVQANSQISSGSSPLHSCPDLADISSL